MHTITQYQRNLNGWVPSAPRDAVFGCARSMIVSFIATTLFTRGNIFAAAKSGGLAAAASVVHTVGMVVIDKIARTVEDRVYLPHLCSGVGLLTAYVFGRNSGINLKWTTLTTLAAYVLTQSQVNYQASTPLFVFFSG